MTYQQAVERLKGKPQRKIGNNTWLVDRGGSIAVKLHNTDVVTFFPCGSVKLDSGGWRTVTTKVRMNEYAPGSISVSQQDYKWYVYHSGHHIPTQFYDGMVLNTKQ